jgi:hypothetical protein
VFAIDSEAGHQATGAGRTSSSVLNDLGYRAQHWDLRTILKQPESNIPCIVTGRSRKAGASQDVDLHDNTSVAFYWRRYGTTGFLCSKTTLRQPGATC